MAINSIRFDLSNWLIHFFRNIDLGSTSSIPYVENMGWENIAEDTHYSALFMLRCAIRSGRLWATWSYRNNVRTIYGPDPAVCFTEMPIAAFIQSGEARQQRGEAMSPFALIFPKKDMFLSGANPVIYGLDDRGYWLPSGKTKGARMIAPDVLPEREQYRYVTYNPTSRIPIDWSHEREWRWPYRGDYSCVEKELDKFGLIEDSMNIPGFDFYQQSITGIGVVVRNALQAKRIVHDILTLLDRGLINENTFGFILVTDDLPNADELIYPRDTQNAIKASLVDLAPYFSNDKSRLELIAKEFSLLVSKVENSSLPRERGMYGGCWLWILDNTSILARALIADGRVIITNSGRYLVNLYEYSDLRSLEQREKMTRELACLVSKKFDGVECVYFSVLNSDNPNDLPFYSDVGLDNSLYFNVSWEG